MALKNVAPRFGRSKNEISNETPTVRPNLDLAAFARESESLLRGALPVPQRDELKSYTRVRSNDLVSPAAVVMLAMSEDDLAWFELSSDASALLKLVDGVLSLEMLAAAAEMPLFDCLREACDLIQQGILRIAGAPDESL